MFKLNTIRDNKGARKQPRVLGRGIGSGLGKTSGRGGKGQTARSGVAINGFEGGQNPIYRRLPKRGFKNIHRIPTFELTIEMLNQYLDSGKVAKDKEVNLTILTDARIARSRHKALSVFGNGELKHAINLVVNRISASAKAIVENAGGKVTLINNDNE